LLNALKRNNGYILKMQNLYTCLFSKDKAKNINNFIVKNTITIWKKIKQIVQELITLLKTHPYGTSIG
jgi:hypothetical protein